MKFSSAADNSISYIDVSSTESVSVNASTSSIPSKRLSSGSPEDLFSTISPKRFKTDHFLGKENIPYSDPKGKGKARAREPPRSPVANRALPLHITLPKPHIQANPALQSPRSIPSLRKAFEALAPDAGLREVQCIVQLAAWTLSELSSLRNPRMSSWGCAIRRKTYDGPATSLLVPLVLLKSPRISSYLPS